MKRVLCIVSAMNTGGAETFLMKLYRKLDKSKYQMDFCVNVSAPGFYDEEIKSMGGRLFYVPPKSKGVKAFRQGLTRVIKENSYEYVMRITSSTMGFMDLAVAKKAGARVCIARSSNSSDGGSLKARVVHFIGRLLYVRYVDVKIAPSDLAAVYTFGEKAFKSGDVSILHNALDLKTYQYNADLRERVRREFEIKDSEIIFGHIGRITKQKNHEFLLDVFSRVSEKKKNARLLLVGDGELLESIKDRCDRLEIKDKVIFAGVRSDIPAVLSAMDAFVFPSLYEGMPNTVIEAQATGLKCFISDTITREANLGRVQYLPIDQGTEMWEKKLLEFNADYERLEMNKSIKKTPYDIEYTVKQFVEIVFSERR